MQQFTTVQEADAWMYEQVDDHCVDNYRFAWADDAKMVAAYEAGRRDGCCGFADYTVIIAGRQAMIGCNFGH